MKIKVFVQSCLMCMLDVLGIQMLRVQQPLEIIICVCVCVFHTDLSLEVLLPVFMYLCVCVCVCIHTYICYVLYLLFTSYKLVHLGYPEGVFRTFSSIVRQMSGYNSQRQGTASTLTN